MDVAATLLGRLQALGVVRMQGADGTSGVVVDVGLPPHPPALAMVLRKASHGSVLKSVTSLDGWDDLLMACERAADGNYKDESDEHGIVSD